MSNFDPSKLNARPSNTSSRGPRSERVFMQVESYETPDNGYHFAVGHRIGNPEEKIRVRLNTVKERVADMPNLSEDAVKAQYVSGENTRDNIAAKSAADIKLIAFDDARRLGENDGVVEYRAHWPTTIATQPEAEVFAGKANIRLQDAFERGGVRTKAQAYVELIKGHAAATAENIDQLLQDALTLKDDQGRARDPMMIMRVRHNGSVVATPRLYPARKASTVFDQATGENREITRPLDPLQTVQSLMESDPGRSPMSNAQLDSVRAIVAGVRGEAEPRFNSTDEAMHAKARSLYWGAKEGHLEVEIISAEKIDFGADSRKTYLKNKDRPQFARYAVKEPNGEQQVREVRGYTDTVVGILRHEDGEPYAIYASPKAMFPKAYKLADLRLADAAPAAEAQAEATQAPTEPSQQEPQIPALATEGGPENEDEDNAPGM